MMVLVNEAVHSSFELFIFSECCIALANDIFETIERRGLSIKVDIRTYKIIELL